MGSSPRNSSSGGRFLAPQTPQEMAEQLIQKVRAADILVNGRLPRDMAAQTEALKHSRLALIHIGNEYRSEPLPQLHLLGVIMNDKARAVTFRFEQMGKVVEVIERLLASPDHPFLVPLGSDRYHGERLEHIGKWCEKNQQFSLGARIEGLIKIVAPQLLKPTRHDPATSQGKLDL